MRPAEALGASSFFCGLTFLETKLGEACLHVHVSLPSRQDF